MTRLALGLIVALALAAGLAAQQRDLVITVTVPGARVADLQAIAQRDRPELGMVVDANGNPGPPSLPTVEQAQQWAQDRCQQFLDDQLRSYVMDTERSAMSDLATMTADERAQVRELIKTLKKKK